MAASIMLLIHVTLTLVHDPGFECYLQWNGDPSGWVQPRGRLQGAEESHGRTRCGMM